MGYLMFYYLVTIDIYLAWLHFFSIIYYAKQLRVNCGRQDEGLVVVVVVVLVIVLVQQSNGDPDMRMVTPHAWLKLQLVVD